MSALKCPICESELKTIAFGILSKDENIVWECIKYGHRFWKSLREFDILHYDPEATKEKGKRVRTWDYRLVMTYVERNA